MNTEEQFYFKVARMIAALEKRNIIRKCVKEQAKMIKPSIQKQLNKDWGLFRSEDSNFKEELHKEIMKSLSKVRIGLENGNENIIQCQIRQDKAYCLMKDSLIEEYPDKSNIIELMIQQIVKRNERAIRDKEALRQTLATAIYRMVNIFRYSYQGENNMLSLNKILNCRYLMIDHPFNKESKTGLMSEKDFSKLILKNEESLIRAAEYFIKKGKPYFTSNHLFCVMEDISPTRFESHIFQAEIRKRTVKIDNRYDHIVKLFDSYKNFY